MEETVRLDASSPPERTAQASGVGRETSAETGLRMGVCISRFLPCPLTISLVTPARYTTAWLGPISQCASTCMPVTTADRRGLQPIMQTYGSSDLQWFTFVHGQRASLRTPLVKMLQLSAMRQCYTLAVPGRGLPRQYGSSKPAIIS